MQVVPATSPLLTVASLAVPGTGQLLAGKKRGVVYLAAEAILLGWHLQSAAVGRRERDGYRNLAFEVARAPFMPTVRDTAFEYFEHMADFVTSGPFDLDPGPGITPPTDETSYNGSVWALASQTFFEDPSNPPPTTSAAYMEALAFYRARAIGPNFQWSWENNGAAMSAFGQGIAASDDAFRRGTILLGFVLANHLVSAIDAHVTRRLSSRARQVRSHIGFQPGNGKFRGAGVTWGLWVWF